MWDFLDSVNERGADCGPGKRSTAAHGAHRRARSGAPDLRLLPPSSVARRRRLSARTGRGVPRALRPAALAMSGFARCSCARRSGPRCSRSITTSIRTCATRCCEPGRAVSSPTGHEASWFELSRRGQRRTHDLRPASRSPAEPACTDERDRSRLQRLLSLDLGRGDDARQLRRSEPRTPQTATTVYVAHYPTPELAIEAHLPAHAPQPAPKRAPCQAARSHTVIARLHGRDVPVQGQRAAAPPMRVTTATLHRVRWLADTCPASPF